MWGANRSRVSALCGFALLSILTTMSADMFIHAGLAQSSDCKFLLDCQTPRAPPPPPPPSSPPPQPQSLLVNNSLGRWAIGEPSNCSVRGKAYSLSLSVPNIIWQSGTGNTDIESIISSGETQFRTTTVNSIHSASPGVALGTTWAYVSAGYDRIDVTSSRGNSFVLVRCP